VGGGDWSPPNRHLIACRYRQLVPPKKLLTPTYGHIMTYAVEDRVKIASRICTGHLSLTARLQTVGLMHGRWGGFARVFTPPPQGQKVNVTGIPTPESKSKLITYRYRQKNPPKDFSPAHVWLACIYPLRGGERVAKAIF